MERSQAIGGKRAVGPLKLQQTEEQWLTSRCVLTEKIGFWASECQGGSSMKDENYRNLLGLNGPTEFCAHRFSIIPKFSWIANKRSITC
jgi:hypothetical protein